MTKESFAHAATVAASKTKYVTPRIVVIGDLTETEGAKSVLRSAEGTKVVLGIKTTYAPS